MGNTVAPCGLCAVVGMQGARHWFSVHGPDLLNGICCLAIGRRPRPLAAWDEGPSPLVLDLSLLLAAQKREREDNSGQVREQTSTASGCDVWHELVHSWRIEHGHAQTSHVCTLTTCPPLLVVKSVGEVGWWGLERHWQRRTVPARHRHVSLMFSVCWRRMAMKGGAAVRPVCPSDAVVAHAHRAPLRKSA